MHEDGHGDEDEDGKLGVHPHHDGPSADEQDDAIDDAPGGTTGEKADTLNILNSAREELTGFGTVVKGEGKVGEFGLQVVAHVVGDILRTDFEPALLKVG